MIHAHWARGSTPLRLITHVLLMGVACASPSVIALDESSGDLRTRLELRPQRRTYLISCLAAILALLIVLFPAPGRAAAYGTVSGMVRDEGNRPVAGANVVLESATHVISRRQTDAEGRFAFATVTIGDYVLTISQGARPTSTVSP